MAEISATGPGQLQQAGQALQQQRPAAPKSGEAKDSGRSGDSPSIQVDRGLLSGIDESEAPADSDAARELALATQPQLAAQTLSIANQSPQKLQGLFRS